MKDEDVRGHRPDSSECPRTRVAQNSVGAVDVCECGMWQLHLGAVTLRLAPCGLSELIALLGSAVAERAARAVPDQASTENTLALPFPFGRKRGEA